MAGAREMGIVLRRSRCGRSGAEQRSLKVDPLQADRGPWISVLASASYFATVYVSALAAWRHITQTTASASIAAENCRWKKLPDEKTPAAADPRRPDPDE
jgi:hypothetical protein